MKQTTLWFALFLTFFVLIALPAQAYIDPGSGSFIFQIIVGGLLGIGFALKTYWRRFVGFFSRKDRPERVPEKVD